MVWACYSSCFRPCTCGHQNLHIAKLAKNVGQKRQHQKVNTLNMQMEVEVKQNIFPITRGEKL